MGGCYLALAMGGSGQSDGMQDSDPGRIGYVFVSGNFNRLTDRALTLPRGFIDSRQDASDSPLSDGALSCFKDDRSFLDCHT
jgi:hypothetical protein